MNTPSTQAIDTLRDEIKKENQEIDEMKTNLDRKRAEVQSSEAEVKKIELGLRKLIQQRDTNNRELEKIIRELQLAIDKK